MKAPVLLALAGLCMSAAQAAEPAAEPTGTLTLAFTLRICCLRASPPFSSFGRHRPFDICAGHALPYGTGRMISPAQWESQGGASSTSTTAPWKRGRNPLKNHTIIKGAVKGAVKGAAPLDETK
jgi:hypothetical protein